MVCLTETGRPAKRAAARCIRPGGSITLGLGEIVAFVEARLCVDMVETVGRTNHDAGRFGIFQLALVLVVAGAGAAFHRMFLDPDVVAADPAVAVALRHLRHNAPRLAAVFGQFDFPGRAVHPGREDVGYDYVRPDIVFVGRIGAWRTRRCRDRAGSGSRPARCEALK